MPPLDTLCFFVGLAGLACLIFGAIEWTIGGPR